MRTKKMIATGIVLIAAGLPALDARAEGPSGASGAESQVAAQAHAEAEAQLRLAAIREKGAKAPEKARVSAETKLAVEARAVDEEVMNHGDQQVAARWAAELGMTSEALLAEKQALGASWGELIIAQTLAASAGGQVTAEQLLALRREGNGWGMIAAGLDLSLGKAVSAVRAEGRVARGLARADGRVAAISGARGALSGGTQARAGAAGVGAKAGAGANVRVNLPKGKGGGS